MAEPAQAAASQPARHVVARADEIAPGASKLVTVKGREIGVFNVRGDFYAFVNKCPHEGAALCKGRVVNLVTSDQPGQYRVSRHGEMLRCPWHGWEFDLRTGQSWCDPEHVWVKRYNVTVEPGADIVKGPYVAETVPVSVEGDYLVVDV